MNPSQSLRLHQISKHSPTMFSTFLKAYSGKSKAAALKALCLDCSCYQRREVSLCSALACPLWLYRPFQSDSQPPTQ